ncbi:hypothetical protein [Eremococcus coleocola]|uniref:hypothetical protein n=1 Tax=Eremococcus coleocola TaxID=88132 RepID=UPI0004069878|nr:hypothetical protein [Eremococcus coleocola]
MEIALIKDGKKTIYKQNKVNVATILKVLEWDKRTTATQNKILKMVQAGIDGELEEDDIDTSAFNPNEDIEFTTDLIVGFFNGQFTYDEFINYAFFKHIGEFYDLASQIFDLAFQQKEEAEDSKQGKKMK